MIEREFALYEDDDIALFLVPCQDSKFTVVTFTPRLSKKNLGPARIQSGFGLDFFKKNGITGFHIVPKWNHWWQVPGMKSIIRIIQEKRSPMQSLWTYGASMGGNGALMFATLVRADGVISINPQASVAPITAAYESRWMDDRNAIADFDDSWLHNPVPQQTWIFGDPGFIPDKQHIDLISNYHPNINCISVALSGHSTTRALMEAGLLSSTILSLMNGNFSPNSFKKNLRINRHDSSVIWTEVSKHLSKRGSHTAALNSSTRAIKLLRDNKAKGKVIDHANGALSIISHLNNILKLRDKDAAEALWEILNEAIVDFDLSWQRLQLADFLNYKEEISEIFESKLLSGNFDERWFSALMRTTKAGIVSPLVVENVEKRTGQAALTADQSERYTLIKSSSPLQGHGAFDFDENVKYIFGPSHALRWSIHATNGVVDCRVSPTNIIGWGGAPIWSKRLFETAKDKAVGTGLIAVIVGDFLYGNKICISTVNQADVLHDGFLGIDATALNPDNDARMLERGLKGVRLWHEHFGNRARFIFWCLFGRQILDRIAGRHVVGNQYKHPTFNYSDITSRLSDVDIVDLNPLLLLPVHEVSRLFIDKNSNPSHIGYLLLDALLVDGVSPLDAYQQTVSEFETELLALARETKQLHHSKILLTGRSVWLDTFVRYMGEEGAAKLANEGIILAPIDKCSGQQYSIDHLPDGILLEECSVFIISSKGTDLSDILAGKTRTTSEAWRNIPIIDWEGSTESIITARKETPNFSHPGVACSSKEIVKAQDVKPSMVELGPFGIPTWLGLRHLLIAIGTMKGNSITGQGDYWIENGVLFSKGTAFLIEGNHSVIKYATGVLKPTKKSLQNFSENIHNRSTLTEQLSIPYAHVIFPDKQSVLEDEFPFKPVHRLGHEYLNTMCSSVRKHVIYPVASLADAGNAFWPLDTHLTDYGSLVVMRSMLEAVGVRADDILTHIEKRINKPSNWSGDLGNKLSPPLKQDGILLNPDWEFKVLRNNIGFNDGLIDVYLNPKAARDCTVLLFGDSFFRMMLRHLSAIFTRVICLRTRYMHPEMLTLIKPDIVFTGNAERYLSNVTSDSDAHAFYLYPYMRQDANLTMGDDFLKVWTALTSPGSSRHCDFLKNYDR